MKEALESDERSKNGGTTQQKIHTAELYKEGRALYKKSLEFNIMDIPEDKRAEVRESRQKMENLDKGAMDRICDICDKLDPKSQQNRRNSPAASNPGYRKPTSAPVKSFPTEKENEKPKSEHKCSRGDRCGAQLGKKTTVSTCSTPRKQLAAVNNPIIKTSSRIASTSTNPNAGVNRSSLLKGVDPKIGERLLDEILDNTGVRLDDVAGCESAKRALEEAVILPSLNPGLFSGLRQPVKGILLYGPPGNGKTLLAKAVAGEANQTFFNISASSLTSKWVGDSEKTIRGLFQIARNSQPAVIFIDEIDSILCQRSEKEAEVSRRMKTEFLVQFDGATTSTEDRILVIGATNRPYELDEAVLRRFPKRIMLGLPDSKARSELIVKTLKKHNMLGGLTDGDIRYIASSTKGYSNSDLVALCKEAAMIPIRSIDKSRLAMTDQSKLRALRASDFDEALRMIRPSTSDNVMVKLNEFSKHAGC